ncbi:MAG: sigma-54-dependent Fis family transcriptional regulator, partial [gamma proteobacterium symbiont of Ctena orbiculata]
RIIAASNRDLEQVVRGGDFREDLYYRLNVLSLRIPALRERKEDIPLLVKHFVETLSAELGITPPQMGEADLVRLLDYDWPGNVRELKNVIERCLLLNKSPSLCMMGSEAVGAQSAPFDPSKTLLLEAIEKQHILKVLDLEGGNKSAAARVLGISRKTLERKTQAWGVN